MKEDKEEYHKIDEFSRSFQEALLTILTLSSSGVLGEFLRFSTSIFLLVGESGCASIGKIKDFLKMVEEILGILPEKKWK